MKLRKIWAIFLAAALICTAVPMNALTSTAEARGYSYTVSNGEATITACDSTISGAVTIPDTLGGYSVTSIGDCAFSYCTGLTSITIPASLTSIGKRAFEGCTSLTGIVVDSGNTAYMSINGVLFNKKKTELICYPTGKSDTSYAIPNSVTGIGDYAFWYCTGLTSITIPASVTSIGDYAFGFCESLTSITIPDGVKSIGACTFTCCTSLTSITIPNSVTSIGSRAFSTCASLTSITIPASVTSISDFTFYGCKSFTSITISDSVTNIGNSAFSNCKSLTSITIPASVTSIASNAFNYCDNLTIYCSENSYAKTFAVENGIKYIIENTVANLGGGEEADLLSNSDKIFREIAGNYPNYLENYPIDYYRGLIYDKCTDVINGYSDWEIVRLAVLEGYFKGTEVLSNELLSFIGGKSTGDKWLEETATAFLKEFETTEEIIYDSWEKVNETYKNIDFAYGAADDISKLNLAASIAKSSKHLTADTITEIVDAAYENAYLLGISNAFDITGKAFDIADLAIMACQLYDFQIENINRLLELTDEQTELHQGLLIIKNEREKGAVRYVLDNFLQKEIASALEKLIGKVGKYATSKLYGTNGSITLAVVSTVNELFYDYIYKVPKITDVHEAIVLNSFYKTIDAVLVSKHNTILKCKINQTELSQEILDDYKFLWDAKTSVLKVYAETCAEMAKDDFDKNYLETELDDIKPLLCFENYIKQCETALRNDIANGTVVCGHYRSYPLRKVQSTCSSEGYTLNYCVTCYKEYVSEVDAIDGHDYTQTVIAPACTSQGYTVYTCNNCRYSYVADYTAAIGHTYTETDVESTCLVRGYTKHTCTTCGNSYNDNYKEVSGHSYEGWITVTESTCSAAGKVSNTCSICSNTEYAKITEEPHTPESEWSVDTAPTESSNGIISHHCEVCGGAVDETELPFLKYESINLSLDNGCGISYKVDKSLFTENGYIAPYACFTVDGNAVSVNTYTEDDYFYTFEYELPYNCRSSDITVRLYADFADVTYQSAELLTNAKAIGSTYCDINGDSEINVMDLIRLKKYIAGFEDTVTDDNADPDNSGDLDSADLSYLKKFILCF